MIDWEDQWARFAPGFKDGLLPISLKRYKKGGKVLLKAGPGFGDLSHPTTRLTLDFLAPLVANRPLFDIGCGSGILSIVGYALGAKEVVGVDIDPEAIEHAKRNAELNRFPITFTLPSPLLPPFLDGVIAMNMISSEQEKAYKHFPRLEQFTGDLVISGLLKKEEEQSRLRFENRGWTYIATKTSKEWLALHFKRQILGRC